MRNYKVRAQGHAQMRKQAQGTDPRLYPFNPSCTSEWETPFEDNKYYHSDWFVLIKVLGNKHPGTYNIEGLACMWY